MSLDTPNGLNSYFDDDVIPDMNDIIAGVASKDEFQHLCEDSANWPETLTYAQFLKACRGMHVT
jgi:hypothetical protein